MSILTATGFDYSVDGRKDGTIEIRIGGVVGPVGREPMVIRMALSDALCFGIDVANKARWVMYDNAVRRQLGTEDGPDAS